MKASLKAKSSNALKWSSLAEIAAKIITPISNLILARLLTPEAFGAVATITMVVSFADTISDSGFQKYLIQNKFKSKSYYKKTINVAFTSNLAISLFLWLSIVILNKEIAILVGNPGLGGAIISAGSVLIVTSFISIYSAVLKRQLDYKRLFYARIINAIVPFIITIPLAMANFGYWSIIIGSIVGNIASAIALKLISGIKLHLLFDIKCFKDMFSFSAWSLIESIGTWLSTYIGTFIVGIMLNNYYLGLYKTTITSINGIFAIVTSATTSVIFSTLSRLQDYKNEYTKTYFNFIRTVAILIMPLGFGIYAYSDLVTKILLGEQWLEVVPFVGLYGLMCSFTLVFGQYYSEYFRGIGKPKYNVLMTLLHIPALVPVLYLSSNKGFEALAFWSSIIKIEQIAAYWLILLVFCKINPIKIFRYTWRSLLCSALMVLTAFILKPLSSNIIYEIISALLCALIYFGFYAMLRNGKNDIKNMAYMFLGKGDKINE